MQRAVTEFRKQRVDDMLMIYSHCKKLLKVHSALLPYWVQRSKLFRQRLWGQVVLFCFSKFCFPGCLDPFCWLLDGLWPHTPSHESTFHFYSYFKGCFISEPSSEDSAVLSLLQRPQAVRVCLYSAFSAALRASHSTALHNEFSGHRAVFPISHGAWQQLEMGCMQAAKQPWQFYEASLASGWCFLIIWQQSEWLGLPWGTVPQASPAGTPYGCSWTVALLTKAPCSSWDGLQGSRLNLFLQEILTGILFSADSNLALFLTFLGSTKAEQKCRSRWRAQL